jgi:hypothetical protein
MIKQLVAFIAAAGFSMSASAGYYQQYELGVTFDDGATMSGFFIQDAWSKGIVYYSFQTHGPAGDSMFPYSNGIHVVQDAEIHIDGGPTSFRFSDYGNSSYFHWFNLIFDWNLPMSPNRVVTVAGGEDAIPTGIYANDPAFPAVYRRITGGYVFEGEADPALLAALDAGPINLNRVEPRVWTGVPEPGTLALLVAGAGVAFMRRRRVRGATRLTFA